MSYAQGSVVVGLKAVSKNMVLEDHKRQRQGLLQHTMKDHNKRAGEG